MIEVGKQKDIYTYNMDAPCLHNHTQCASAPPLCGRDTQPPPPAQYAKIDNPSIIHPVCFKQ